MKVKIIFDPCKVYEEQQVIDANSLIQDYIDGLTDDENDESSKQWLRQVSPQTAVKFISLMWDLQLVEIE